MPNIKVTKDKNGMYHARVFSSPDSDGKRISKRITGYTEREVRRQAEDFLEEMKRQPKAFGMTLREATAKYINYLENKKKPLAASTIRRYDSYARCHFQELQDVSIVSITDSMIQKEIYALEESVGAKTIRNVVNFYVPCIRHFRKGFRPELELPDLQRPVTKVPDMSELREKIINITNTRLKVPVLLAAYCGMRESEIAALDLNKDIEYDKTVSFGDSTHQVSIIHITKAMVMDKNNEYVIKETKTDAGTRDLFIPKWLGDILKEIKDDPTYKPYPPHKMASRFCYWAKKNNIECSLHGLRHFYASFMDALNIPDNYAMLLMGHSTDTMLKRYQEIMKQKSLEVNRDLLIFLENNAPLHHKNAPLTDDK